MSLRTIQRIAFACGLALVGLSAAACKDDNKKKETDAGKTDAGGDGDGDVTADAGMDSGMPAELACNPDPFKATKEPCTCEGSPGVDCKPHNAGILTLNPCCDTNHGGVCGVAVPALAGPLAGCHQEMQKGNDSEGCGQFLDTIEGKDQEGLHTNGKYDVDLDLGHVALGGCCTPEGICGIVVNMFEIVNTTDAGMSSTPVNSDFGCIPVTDFAAPTADAGMADAGAGGGPSIPPFCVPDKKTDDLACPPKLSISLGGKDVNLCDTLNEALHGALIGCDPTADFPAWACAAQGGQLADGSAPVVGDCMEYLPKFLGGCGAGVQTDGKCVTNVPTDKYGCVDVTQGPLPGIPKIVCGCGPDATTTPTGFPCLAHTNKDVCGADEPSDAQLAQIPEFTCGCGATTVDPGTGFPCLSNEAATVCGTKPITAGSAELAGIPKFLCGCEGSTATELGCLKNVAKDVCGGAAETPYLPAIPTFVCGCGASTLDSGYASLCMSNVDKTTCGSKAATTDDKGDADPANDCVVGVPEFARGCGLATEPSLANPTCLRDTPALFGCVNIPNATPAIPRVPEYLCGCGEETPYTGSGIPCLSFVGNNTTSGNPICGATPISSTAQVLPIIPNNLCGCGDGVISSNPCLDNVPNTVCGPAPVCSPVGVQGSCDAGQTCTDSNADTIGDVCAT